MAAALVGGAVLSGFLNVVFERLVPEDVLQLLKGDKLIEQLLRKLNTMLLSATALLNDAEEKQLGDTSVRNWLDQLKQVVYEADRVTDKINTQAQRRTRKRSRCNNVINNPFWKSEIEEILDTLKDLLEQSHHLGLKIVDQKFTTLHTPHAPLLDDSQVHGREGDKEAILNLLLCDGDDDSPNISVVPIVGMGGIGKTTLAQSVYYDNTVQDHFALKVWVTISDDFDVLRITKLILEAIPKAMPRTVELHRIQKDLKDALAGKKFLFVFDDVWNEKYQLWALLQSSFQSGAKGSKVIVTTRNEDIALRMKTRNVQTYELKTMSDDQCWKLFEEHAFDNVDRNEKVLLEDLTRDWKKNCQEVQGRPFSCKINGWSFTIDANLSRLETSLWLSYRFLPPYLKPCLSYLSIFPKDYEFRDVDRKKLIFIWMAEGLLQPQEGRTIEDVGKDYLNALISRSFFQRNTRNDFFSMHDLIHDLAVYVSGQSFLSYDSYKKDLHKLSSKTHHLSYDYYLNAKEIDFTKVKNLRSLISLPLRSIPSSSLETDVQEVVLRNGGLRVLSFVGEHIDLIRNLKHLRYLDASKSLVKELPDSIGGSHNLETLLLSECYMLTQLPDSIGNLKYLRYLDASNSKVKELPASICALHNLETLLLSECRMLTQLPESIGNLKHLRYLDASGSEVKELPASICELHNLETLLLSECYMLTQLPDSIGNLKYLRYLDASGSEVKELPASICALHNLETLLLSRCSMLTQLPDSIGNLKYLRYLDVSYTKVKELPDSVCLLYNLETLLLEYCKQLTLLPTKICELINLRHLNITSSSLKEMPPWISNMKNLQKLSDFILCENDGHRIKELGKLDNLHGSLRISGIRHVREVNDVLEVNLKNKEYLTELRLEWAGRTNDSIRDGEILTALQPHPNLKSLEIDGYQGTKLPEWVVDPLYSNLEVFCLDGQNCCLSLLSFQHLSSLKKLNINLMAIDIPHEFCNNCSHNSFRVLEEIHLASITTSDWSFISTNDQKVDIFPCLKKFDLFGCGKLNVALPMGNFPSLEVIKLNDCDELVTVFPSSSTDINVAYPSLESVDIESCNKLIENRMQWNLQRLSKLTELRLVNYGGVVDSFPEEGLLPPSLTSLHIDNFDKLTALNPYGFHHLTSLQQLYLRKLEKLECLPATLPQTLTTLTTYDCALLIPRCKRETGEDWLNIQHIPNIYIDEGTGCTIM
ncbi:hypothetical protein CsatB_013300 [Cannabis sativa]